MAACMQGEDAAAAAASTTSAASVDGDLPRRPPGLVVVATLVDKIPNLAGLARTCEAGRMSTHLIHLST